jgi:hypothetical protein
MCARDMRIQTRVLPWHIHAQLRTSKHWSYVMRRHVRLVYLNSMPILLAYYIQTVLSSSTVLLVVVSDI